MRAVIAFLRSQNTHFAWWTGVLGTSLVLFVVLGGKDTAELWTTAHLDGFAHVANWGLEGVTEVAIWCWFPALIGAVIGRPPWIPQRGFFIAKDELSDGKPPRN